MSGDLNISMSADDKGILKTQAKVIRQQDEMITGYKKLLSEAKNAAKQGGTELERFAAKTNKINKAPAQRYKEEVQKLNQALKAGLITQTTYNRAVQRLGRSHTSTFGAAGTQVASLVGGYFSLASAAGAVSSALSDIRNELDQLGEQQKQDAPALGQLQQLTNDPKEVRRMVLDAKRTFAEGGASSIDQAAQLQFALESAGVGRFRKDVSALQANAIVLDAKELVDSAAALQTSMGEKETGSFREIVSKAFGASRIAPAYVDQILAAAASSGSQAKALGMSDEEVLAATAAIAKIEKGAQPARTQVESLLKQIEKFGIGEGYLESGKPLMEQIATIKELEAGGTNIRDILGDRQEGIKAYRSLASTDAKGGGALFREAMKYILQDQAADAFGQKVRAARTATPEVIAWRTQRISEAKEKLELQKSATTELLADTVESEIMAKYSREGYGDKRRWILRQMNWFERLMGGNQAFIDAYKGKISPSARQGIDTAEQAMQETAVAMREAASDFRSAVGEAVGSQTNAARANQAAAGGATEAR